MIRAEALSRLAPAAAWFKTPSGALVVTLLASGLLVIQGARLALALRERGELVGVAKTLSGGPARDAVPARPFGDAAAIESRLEEGAPAGGQPGPVLRDAVRLLRGAEIYEYRYQFLDPSAEPRARNGAAEQRGGEALAIPLPSADPAGSEADAALPAIDLPAEDPAAPGEWTRWRLQLEFASSYPRLVQLLENLHADGRIWTVPRMVCRRTQGMVETDLVLETFTRADAPAREAAPGAARAARDAAPRRDPFRNAWVVDGRDASSRALPRLGAVSHGSLEAAWLDGQRVRPGETVGGWTLVAIQDGEVVLRDEEGKDVHLGSGAAR